MVEIRHSQFELRELRPRQKLGTFKRRNISTVGPMDGLRSCVVSLSLTPVARLKVPHRF
jgi:hypothetical protein